MVFDLSKFYANFINANKNANENDSYLRLLQFGMVFDLSKFYANFINANKNANENDSYLRLLQIRYFLVKFANVLYRILCHDLFLNVAKHKLKNYMLATSRTGLFWKKPYIASYATIFFWT